MRCNVKCGVVCVWGGEGGVTFIFTPFLKLFFCIQALKLKFSVGKFSLFYHHWIGASLKIIYGKFSEKPTNISRFFFFAFFFPYNLNVLCSLLCFFHPTTLFHFHWVFHNQTLIGKPVTFSINIFYFILFLCIDKKNWKKRNKLVYTFLT